MLLDDSAVNEYMYIPLQGKLTTEDTEPCADRSEAAFEFPSWESALVLDKSRFATG